MKYDIVYSCGHSGKVELFGKNSEREKRLLLLEQDLCPECCRNEQLQQAVASSHGYPELSGTEKQVNWALTLRIAFVQQSETYKSKVRIEDQPSVQAALDHLIKTKTNAGWWIDHREAFVPRTLAEAFSEINDMQKQEHDMK